ncbi:MAG: alpha/beta hydrolase [Betaproteobacteria bacterium]|nr:alpha/beta hydrolase [Betaproteobacteria bacterium]
MRAATRRELVAGPAGRIECAIDAPENHKGVALIAHPHPLYGGTLDNKVVQTLARIFVDLGYVCVRPNFRGVGATEGVHDEGRGELEDLTAVLDYAQDLFGAADEPSPPVLAGFSFGAFVQTCLAERVKPERMVLVGVAVKRFAARPVPGGTLVIHGEVDQTVPLADVLDWARPQDLPVIVVPGADHFFHQKLNVLRSIVQSNWRGR